MGNGVGGGGSGGAFKLGGGRRRGGGGEATCPPWAHAASPRRARGRGEGGRCELAGSGGARCNCYAAGATPIGSGGGGGVGGARRFLGHAIHGEGMACTRIWMPGKGRAGKHICTWIWVWWQPWVYVEAGGACMGRAKLGFISWVKMGLICWLVTDLVCCAGLRRAPLDQGW